MYDESSEIFGKKVIIRIKGATICESADELFESTMFRRILVASVRALEKRQSVLLNIFGGERVDDKNFNRLVETLKYLAKMPIGPVINVVSGSDVFFQDRNLFSQFVEYLYNFWRSYDRFLLCDSTGDVFDKRPYRTFNMTIEHLTQLIRKVYRDIEENITSRHPAIYRQVAAGAEIAAISIPRNIPLSGGVYEKLKEISIIRQILLYPPMILNPPINKRTGAFHRIEKNPAELISLEFSDWLCYPAKVGTLVVLVYIHKKYFELGFSLCNLFELAGDEDLDRSPDAIYFFGVPDDSLDGLAEFPTVFYDDENNNLLVAAAPGRDEFGYFGYLKKMILTLHNIVMMKRELMPFHGALVKIFLANGCERSLLVIGDTGAGKSETLESLRDLAGDRIRDMVIIADDMGSLEIGENGDILGHGTEIGAFLRLDDLKPGYAFGQIDRAIIMSPNKVNARIVMPVTTFEDIILGCRIDFMLYANNYEEIDEDHPVIEVFNDSESALRIFREGTVMSKGTTTSTGIVHSYFANVFGPVQYREQHDRIARRYFEAMFNDGVVVGQMRTRLGIAGYERKGPEEAALQLIGLMESGS